MVTAKELAITIDEVLPEVVSLRHELHMHPEVHFEEHWTSDRVTRFLGEAEIPCKRGYAKGTGLVATLEGSGDKTIALRADMDALNLQECTGLAYASTVPQRMHACGHDGHMACLCGAARALAQHRHRLGSTVKFVFQPAEESAGGGRSMVEEGVLEGADAVFALHAWPATPVGHIGLRAGTIMASAGWFRVTIHGKGCHGGEPASGIDPVVVAAHVTAALQTIASRELDPCEAGVVTVGRIEAGTASNVIPDVAFLEGTIRALTVETVAGISAAIERLVKHTALAFRAEAEVQFGDTNYPPTVNDPRMTEFARETAAETLGPDRIVEVPHPSMTSEDFAFYLQRVPGAFIWLGNAPTDDTPSPPLHSPFFDFNDDALLPAVKLLTGLVARFR